MPVPQFKTWFNPRLEPDYLDESVLNIYYNAYVFNLKTYSRLFRCFFIHPSELSSDGLKPKWPSEDDPFLEESKADIEAFAEDLLANGTYWHIAVQKAEAGYKLRVGHHRFYAVRMLLENNKWPAERKLLAVSDELEPAESFPPNLDYYVPFAVSAEFKRQYAFIYSKLKNAPELSMEAVDNFIRKSGPPSERGRAGYHFAALFTFLLRESFYEYRCRIKRIYPPHRAINVEEEWSKWKPQDFTGLLRKF